MAQDTTPLFIFIGIFKSDTAIKSPQSTVTVDAICPARLAAQHKDDEKIHYNY
jgi:hypothetical protein